MSRETNCFLCNTYPVCYRRIQPKKCGKNSLDWNCIGIHEVFLMVVFTSWVCLICFWTVGIVCLNRIRSMQLFQRSGSEIGLILICLYCFQSDKVFSERGIPMMYCTDRPRVPDANVFMLYIHVIAYGAFCLSNYIWIVEPQELPPLNMNTMAPVSMQYILQNTCSWLDDCIPWSDIHSSPKQVHIDFTEFS